MASRRFKQMDIIIKWKNKFYAIRAESIKPTLKQDSEEYTATKSIKPYAIAFEGQSYEFDIGAVDPEHYKLFKEIYKQQNSDEKLSELLFNVATYDYDPSRKLRQRDRFVGCIITELSNETAEPFDVKCSAINWE